MAKRIARNEKEDSYKINYLLSICKCSLLAMCEQEWVTQRVFRVCESKEESLKPFNCSILRNNAIGEQLIRIGLRRRNERHIKQQLMVCNGNSKKSLIGNNLINILEMTGIELGSLVENKKMLFYRLRHYDQF